MAVTQKLLFVIFLLLNFYSIFTESAYIRLYDESHFKRSLNNYSVSLDIGCVSLPSSSRKQASSINTEGLCIYIFDTIDCTGSKSRMAPGTKSHYDLSEISWNNRVMSLADCDWVLADKVVTNITSTTSTTTSTTTTTTTETPTTTPPTTTSTTETPTTQTSAPFLISTTELTTSSVESEEEPQALPLTMNGSEISLTYSEVNTTKEILIVDMSKIIEETTTSEAELDMAEAEYEAGLVEPSPICLPSLSNPFLHEVVIKSENKAICSGSIIAPTFILTSAHCLDNEEIEDLTVTTASSDVGVNIKFVNTHESYGLYSYDDDLTILELANSLNYSKVNHIILPEQNEKFEGKSLAKLFDVDGGSSALCWKEEISNWVLCGLRRNDGTYLEVAKYAEWVEKAEREIRENNFRKIYEAAINVHLPKVREMIQEHIEGRRTGGIPQKDDDGRNITTEYCVGMRWANPYCWFIH